MLLWNGISKDVHSKHNQPTYTTHTTVIVPERLLVTTKLVLKLFDPNLCVAMIRSLRIPDDGLFGIRIAFVSEL